MSVVRYGTDLRSSDVKVPFTEKRGRQSALIEELKRKPDVGADHSGVGEKVMQGFLESLLAYELDAAVIRRSRPEGAKTGSESTDAKPSP